MTIKQNKNIFQNLKSKTLEKLKDFKTINRNEFCFITPMRTSKKNNLFEKPEDNRGQSLIIAPNFYKNSSSFDP